MRRLLAGTFASLAIAASAAAKPPPDAHPLQDLYYGDVLFHYFQGDEFDALARLLVARSEGRPQASGTEGELLMAGLLLSFDQSRDALASFERVLQTETRPDVRNPIWLTLARTLHQRGADAEALAALARIDAPLRGDLEADRQMLKAELLIDAGRFDEAARLLQDWRGSRDWMSYARYNLGVALIRANRIDEGAAQLDQIDHSGLRAAEQLDLRDRANTALGYTYLQAQRWEDARNTLRRVRLEGESTSKALLGLGWAEAGLGQDRDALVPWMELASRDGGDVAVQESLLAVPYAMARAGSPSAAAVEYQKAVDRYEQESQRLGGLANAIRQPAYVDRLVDGLVAQLASEDGTPKRDDGRPIAPLQQIPDAPEYRGFSELIASNGFQAGLRNARQLVFLKSRLADWSGRVSELSAQAPSSDWAGASARVSRLREASERLLDRQRQALQNVLLREIEQRQQRLRAYQAEARFAQAKLLDRSAIAPPKAPK
ncbi:tetratricopeptide repeat protein [Hydrocarboniphaga effusa]|uniref:Tetratricopeptide repeat protein n=1 Tax=Hydrocarboniphaga effusa AP103 TaxID=1172194 RepID=I7ZAJ4_9GAMM|nr:tetratricopeptide repeat protein [Hydrocarboniphaga effusa]EIT68884.1 hypothetical protein WQQ_24660 [Hydrocarboniphaga effusa AP103]